MASGSRSRSMPSISTRRVMVDLPAPFGPAINVRVGRLRGAAAHFAEDFIVRAGGGARNPADLKATSVGLLHHREAQTPVHIKDRTTSRESFLEGLPARRGYSRVELRAVELVF